MKSQLPVTMAHRARALRPAMRFQFTKKDNQLRAGSDCIGELAFGSARRPGGDIAAAYAAAATDRRRAVGA